MKLLVAIAALALAGCATTASQQQTGAALENVALGLLCAQSGVCITPGTAEPACKPPPIPRKLLKPCTAPPADAAPAAVVAALRQCELDSSLLLTVMAYADLICKPKAAPSGVVLP